VTEFDPVPESDGVETVREHWRDGVDTFDRVYDTLLGCSEPTSAADVAEIADCSRNAAKKHLDRLVDLGVARADRGGRPVRYERNDGYLEWQEASRIADELTVDEIVDRVRELEARGEEFADRFGTATPDAVSVFECDDHDAIHERMAAVSEWRAVERDVRLYELARRLATNDGRLLPA